MSRHARARGLDKNICSIRMRVEVQSRWFGRGRGVCNRQVNCQPDPNEYSERYTPTAGDFKRLRLPDVDLPQSYNAAPGQLLPIVVEPEPRARVLVLGHWGLLPGFRGADGRTVTPTNARAETLLDRPTFRGLVPRHRCLIPATGYYEWRREGHRRQPYLFTVTDQTIFSLAGLWNEMELPTGETLRSYVVVTTAPNAVAAEIHDRMPAILRPDDEAEWLDPEVIAARRVTRLLRPYPADLTEAYPVSSAVNDPRNDGPDLLAPARPRRREEARAITLPLF